MPVLAELAASSQVGQREDSAGLDPERGTRGKCRRLREREASVPGQERRVRAVEREPLAVDEKHRDLRPVLGGIGDL